MDELQIIREQLATEARHLAEVRTACAAAIAARFDGSALLPFCGACAEYLAFALTRSSDRDAAHAERLRPHLAESERAGLAVLDALQAAVQPSRSLAQGLAEACRLPANTLSNGGPIEACRTRLPSIDLALAGQRESLESLLEQHYAIDDWREASLVDADAILEERRLYARVLATLPAGIVLEVPKAPRSADASARR